MSGGGNSASVDRHLKKIYDHLNVGGNKKAVQEVDRLPKNVRDLTVFRALKALALIRMCKRRQAFDILNEISPEDDLDEITLQTMTSCYKESVDAIRTDAIRIVDLYEAASKRKPNDSEIMAHLFMAHVRVFNFKRQKEIALLMYKSFPKKKRLFSFWAIMSLVMQSQEGDKSGGDAPDKRVCLSLAEKMCEKMIDDERTNEEIELYLNILRKQNKHEEEYKFLTGPVCLRITDHLSWFNRRRAYLCLDLKMYSRAFKHYFPTLIQEYPDQIEYYQGLFKSAFLLDTEAPSQQQPIVNEQVSQNNSQSTGTPVKSTSALAECYDIVERQCSLTMETVDPVKDQPKGKSQGVSKNLSRTSSLNPARHKLLRGPFLARCELYYTILSNESLLPENVFNHCRNQFSSKYPTLNALILDYFQSNCRRPICYYDMEYMMVHFKLSSSDKQSILEMIDNWFATSKAIQDLSAYDLFHAKLNHHLLEHSLHAYSENDTFDDRLKIAKKYIDAYDEHRSLCKGANKTEFLPVDPYCLLAVNSIMTNAVNLDNLASRSILSDSVLATLMVMLEIATTNSPANHQVKLTLLKLYSFVGASRQCSDLTLFLDLKNFQIDTLGHLLNPVVYNTGNYAISKESLDCCLEVYSHGLRECLEGLTTSYRDGRFSKIEEISNVLRRLSDSLNATQCVLLRGIMSNIHASTQEGLQNVCQQLDDSFKGLDRLFGSDEGLNIIKDSRDFKVLRSYHFETNELLQRKKEENLRDEFLWLRMRYFLLHGVYSQYELLTNSKASAQEKKNYKDELEHASEIVSDLIPQVESATACQTDRRFSFFEPESSPFRWKHISFKSLVDLVRPLVFIADVAELNKDIEEGFIGQIEMIIGNLELQLSSIGSLVEMKQALLSLTISVEFISLATTSLVSLHQHTPTGSATGSGNSATVATASAAQPASSGSAKTSASQQASQPVTKHKSITQKLMNKTEIQLTRLSNILKSTDPSILLDKITKLEESLISEERYSRIETKYGSTLYPLLSPEISTSFLAKVKHKLAESYNESIQEIESACRRKIKLLKN